MLNLLATKGIILASVIGVISYGLRASGLFFPDYPIVETLQGALRGVISVSRDGRDYYGFLGINYALPPINELRFEPPVAAKSWDGIREANKYSADCYQYDGMVTGRFLGSEDCLYLNVFTPNLNASLPVMLWIHGGGFMSGGASSYNPKYLMDEDVVIVTINYRLGALGFLNTGDGVILGNMGLKDQNLAMRWVKNNIRNFGGDPDNIALWGESAGGASVHYHIISPASKGLFNKAIIQSGAVTCPWSLESDPKNQAVSFGKSVNCPTDNSTVLVSCLKKSTPENLVTFAIQQLADAPIAPRHTLFVPSVEVKGTGQSEAFLTENPRKLIQKGQFTKVPLLLGITQGEGALRTARLQVNENALQQMDINWEKYIPTIIGYDPSRKDVSKKLKEYYFKNKKYVDDEDEFLRAFTKMTSDGLFFHSVNKAASYHSRHAPVHLYFYSYNASIPSIYSFLKAVQPDDWILAEVKIIISALKDLSMYWLGYAGPYDYGPCHADDILQQWRLNPLLDIGARSWSSDYDFSKAFIQSFVQFASHPGEHSQFNGINWPATTAKSQQPFEYMQLDGTGKVIQEPFHNMLAFWDSLNIRDY